MISLRQRHGYCCTGRVGRPSNPLSGWMGSKKIISFLLSRRASIDSAMTNGAQPLHMASQASYRANVIEFLCSKGADIEAETHNGHTPLSYSFDSCSEDNMEILLKLGAAHSLQAQSILGLAVDRGYLFLQVTRLLLERGVDPNRPVSGGRTALHNLLIRNPEIHCDHDHLLKDTETLELLLAYGADVNLQDSNGIRHYIFYVGIA